MEDNTLVKSSYSATINVPIEKVGIPDASAGLIVLSFFFLFVLHMRYAHPGYFMPVLTSQGDCNESG